MCQILDALRERDGQSKGRLHRVLFGEGLERKRFEILLGSLVRARFVHEQADSFEKEGETIHFRRLHLSEDGRRARAEDVATLQVPKEQSRTRRAKRGTSTRPRTSRAAAAGGGGEKSSRRSRAAASLEAAEAPKALVLALKGWRLKESRRRRCPAFRILTDRTLMGIASEIPRDEEALLAIRGMGPTTVRKYGEEILAITNEC